MITMAEARAKGKNWGGARPGAGRPKGSITGRLSQRFKVEVSSDYRAWMMDFAASLGGTELGLFREALESLAEARNFQPPPLH